MQARLKLNPHRQSLPSIFLANVRSLANKVDELRLRITQRKFMDCNVMVFTETWLNNTIPASAIELQGCNIYRADKTVADSGKSKGGGVCIYVMHGALMRGALMLLFLNPTVRLTLNTCSSSVDRSTCPMSFHLS